MCLGSKVEKTSFYGKFNNLLQKEVFGFLEYRNQLFQGMVDLITDLLHLVI